MLLLQMIQKLTSNLRGNLVLQTEYELALRAIIDMLMVPSIFGKEIAMNDFNFHSLCTILN
jgi:hypothetical protein